MCRVCSRVCACRSCAFEHNKNQHDQNNTTRTQPNPNQTNSTQPKPNQTKLNQPPKQSIQRLVAGLDLWSVLAIFCALVLLATTFVSHTVGAMVVLPIVQSVGQQLPGEPHDKLLVMGAALMCSGAMGLPVSGFPNMNAVALEDPTGVNYVDTSDFLKVGVPGSVLVYFVIISVGYVLMRAVGF